MDYKKEEEAHYNSRYTTDAEYYYPSENDVSSNDKVTIPSRRYIESRTSEIISKYNRRVDLLDFGCAIGEKTYKFSSKNVSITGIDISGRSIEIANKLALRYRTNASFMIMDCENLQFEDDKFDIVYDFGTFSSIDINRAIPEICRVLKDDGFLIAIETLGNNPFLSLKRRLNVLAGSRTSWAANHILKINDLKKIGENFSDSEIRFFTLFTLLARPLLFLVPESKHIDTVLLMDKIDKFFLKFRIFQFFAFKAVAIMSKPKKSQK